MSEVISAVSLVFAFTSFIFALRSDRRARESVRPYLSTGIHVGLDDMSVSLTNYGAGLAIITKIFIRRGEGEPKRSLGHFLSPSPNYEIQPGVIFVQDRYFMRPGDSLPLGGAIAKGNRAEEAVRDWSNSLEGIKIELEYLDLFGKQFHYNRLISMKGAQ
jgi:hypothetical protein